MTTAVSALDLPQQLAQGTTLIFAPHMDDAVLGCGGTLAKLPAAENVHIVYATDGSRSPVPNSLRRAKSSPELRTIRAREAQKALSILGVPEQNLHFLDFPDGSLSHHRKAFYAAVVDLLQQLQPTCVLMPFRYDCHADHVTVSAIIAKAIYAFNPSIQIFEYFIYYRLQLLPNKDIRTYIRDRYLLTAPIDIHSAQKRRALEAFKTQTTCFYPWQTRPLLSKSLLDEVCTAPELFLNASALGPKLSPFAQRPRLIPLITRVEPILKKTKTRAILFLKTLMGFIHRQSKAKPTKAKSTKAGYKAKLLKKP